MNKLYKTLGIVLASLSFYGCFNNQTKPIQTYKVIVDDNMQIDRKTADKACLLAEKIIKHTETTFANPKTSDIQKTEYQNGTVYYNHLINDEGTKQYQITLVDNTKPHPNSTVRHKTSHGLEIKMQEYTTRLIFLRDRGLDGNCDFGWTDEQRTDEQKYILFDHFTNTMLDNRDKFQEMYEDVLDELLTLYEQKNK